MLTFKRGRLLAALFLTTLAPAAAWAQGSIAGVVRDTSGAVLPGVTVEASSPALIEKTRSVITDGTGQYKIIDLRPGGYEVTFTLAGFNTVKREGIELTGSFIATVNADLKVGAVEETITVTGESPVVDVQGTLQQRVLSKDVIDAVPSGRTVMNLVQLIPGVTGGGQDVGGTVGAAGNSTLAIHGSRSGDQRVTIDGLSTNSMEGTGANSGYFGNMSSSQEVAVDTGGASAEQSQAGIRVNIIPRDGGNTFSGSLFASGATSSLQSSNYTQELKNAGLTTPDSLESMYDVNPGFGGPLVKDKVWFFSAARWNRNKNYVAGMFYNKNAGNPNAWVYEPDTTRPADTGAYQRSVNTRITWQATAKNKFSVFYDDQSRCAGCPRVTASTSPEAAPYNNGFPRTNVMTATWSSPITSRMLVEAGAVHHPEGWHWTGSDGPDPTQIGVIEQSTGIAYHGPQQSGCCQGIYAAYDATINQVRAAVSYVTGAHAMKVGFSDGWAERNLHVNDNIYNLTYRFNNGVPNQLTQRATPYDNTTKQRADFGSYAQDRWTLKRATVNLGVRFDYYNSYFPEQHLGPARLVPTRNITFPETPLTHWSDITPRFGLAYDLFGNGKTALRTSLNKYVLGAALQGTFGDAANPVALLANQVTRSWNDLFYPVGDARRGNYLPDCDLTNTAANAECGVMSNTNFGKPILSTVYDPETLGGFGHRGFNWEFSTGIQQEVLPRLAVNVTYFRRWYGNFSITDNRAVVASDYSTFSITAPVDPRLPGGGGYAIAGLYDLNPNKVGLVDNYLTFSDSYGSQIEHWNGIDVTVNSRLRSGLLLQGGLSTGRTSTDSCELAPKVDNPSTRFCHVDTPFLTQVKLIGSYVVPKVAVQLSGTFQSVPGPQISANYNAPNASVQPSLGRALSGGAANVTVNLIEPGTMYGQRSNQLDVRIGKTLKFAQARSTISVDLYNMLNANPVLSVNNNFAAWQVPQSILTARFAKFSVQFDF